MIRVYWWKKNAKGVLVPIAGSGEDIQCEPYDLGIAAGHWQKYSREDTQKREFVPANLDPRKASGKISR